MPRQGATLNDQWHASSTAYSRKGPTKPERQLIIAESGRASRHDGTIIRTLKTTTAECDALEYARDGEGGGRESYGDQSDSATLLSASYLLDPDRAVWSATLRPE